MLTEGYNMAIQIITYENPTDNLFYAYLILVIVLQSQGIYYFMAYFTRFEVRESWCALLFPNYMSNGWLMGCFCLYKIPSKYLNSNSNSTTNNIRVSLTANGTVDQFLHVNPMPSEHTASLAYKVYQQSDSTDNTENPLVTQLLADQQRVQREEGNSTDSDISPLPSTIIRPHSFNVENP